MHSWFYSACLGICLLVSLISYRCTIHNDDKYYHLETKNIESVENLGVEND